MSCTIGWDSLNFVFCCCCCYWCWWCCGGSTQRIHSDRSKLSLEFVLLFCESIELSTLLAFAKNTNDSLMLYYDLDISINLMLCRCYPFVGWCFCASGHICIASNRVISLAFYIYIFERDNSLPSSPLSPSLSILLFPSLPKKNTINKIQFGNINKYIATNQLEKRLIKPSQKNIGK